MTALGLRCPRRVKQFRLLIFPDSPDGVGPDDNVGFTQLKRISYSNLCLGDVSTVLQ